MRIAVVSDIHGNRTALEAVIADLRVVSPDLVFHGGDLADAGSSPVEVLDRIRDLGWPGVVGNTDEMLADPDSLATFAAAQSPQLHPMFAVIEEMAAAVRSLLGAERLAWLAALPGVQLHDELALVHASPESAWRAPTPAASDAELEAAYSKLARPVAVYGHVHQPFTRNISGMIVANSGSAGLPYDGDRRACYLLLDDGKPEIRRVEYDIAKELKALATGGRPHSDWIARMLETARPQMP